MKAFILKNSVELAHMNMCQVGMVVDNELVLKPTTFMTNGPKLAEALRLSWSADWWKPFQESTGLSPCPMPANHEGISAAITKCRPYCTVAPI